MTKTAALYARFSSDIQKDTSIDRQFADLEKAAARLGLKLDKRHYYSDRAQTATSLFDRPGLTRELLGAAKRREFEVVLVEMTDRLSRNRADLFWLADQFKFDKVQIFTPAGEVSSLQLTFDGHQNEEFSAKLAMRVKSGGDAAARAGLIPGPAPYGYDCVAGKPGVKVINPEEAKVILRIFREYASGKSPRKIAADLMKDKVPSPTGTAHWLYQSIIGGAGQKRGMLHNQTYVGVYLKNRFVNVKNPSTGKTITREADAGDLIRVEMPELRIISDELWNAAHKVRAERSIQMFGKGYARRAVIPRSQHLLAGLLKCGACNERMIINSQDRKGRKGVICSAANGKQTCQHRKTYNLDKLTAFAIDKMCAELSDPEMLKERARARALEHAKLARENSAARQTVQKQIDRLDVQIGKLVRLADQDDGDELPPELVASLKEKQIERRGLDERVRLLDAESNVITLHPAVIKTFGQNVEILHEKLKRNPDDQQCRIAFANITDSIIVHPTVFGAPYEISLYARLSAIIGGDVFFVESRAGQGVSRVLTEAGTVKHACLNKSGEHEVIFLGRFLAAA